MSKRQAISSLTSETGLIWYIQSLWPLPEIGCLSFQEFKFILLHYGTVKTLWDWIMLLFTLYVVITGPFFAAKQTMDADLFATQNATNIHIPTYIYGINIVLEFIFILDIALKFRTTFVDKKGQLVPEPKKIAVHYGKSAAFYLDLVSAVPFDFISLLLSSIRTVEPMHSYFTYLKCVRIVRIYNLYKIVDTLSQYRGVVLAILMLVFVLVAHWTACVWFVIGWTEYGETPPDNTDGPGWLFHLGEAMDTPFGVNKTGGPGVTSAYISALYFTLSSLTSVGFGNVSANTDPEKCFSICVMLIGAIMHAIVFGNITAVIQRMYANRSEFDRRERNLNEFLKKNEFEKPMLRRLTDFFQANWKSNNGVDEKEVINEFPKDLQADIYMHLHKTLLDLPVFEDACEGCKRYASTYTSRRRVAPTEIFIHIGDPLEHVFVVDSGSLQMSRDGEVRAILSTGDVFGGDFTKQNIITSSGEVKALTFCDIQCISREGLTKIATIYPNQSGIAKDLRDSYSCRLSGSSKEDYRHKTVAKWNKHYGMNRTEDIGAMTCSDSDQSCHEVKVVIEADSDEDCLGEDVSPCDQNGSENIFEESGRNFTNFTNDNCVSEAGIKCTLQVPEIMIEGNSLSHSSSNASCPSPCLRLNEKAKGVRKRVSFDDRECMVRTKLLSTSENDDGGAIVHEAAFSNPVEINDQLSRLVSNTTNLRGAHLRGTGDMDSDTNPPTCNVKQHGEPNHERTSTSPGTCGELRRKRRRRKHAHRSDPMSSSDNDQHHGFLRERKMSVVEMCGDPARSLVYQRHSSPESRSSECGCRSLALEERMRNLESLVWTTSKKIELIMDCLLPKTNVDGDGGSIYANSPTNSERRRRFPTDNLRQRLHVPQDEPAFDPTTIEPHHYQMSPPGFSPGVMDNRADHWTRPKLQSSLVDESVHCAAMRRPNSAPSIRSTLPTFSAERDTLQPREKVTLGSNTEAGLSAFKSIYSHSEYDISCRKNTFSDTQSSVLVDLEGFESDSTTKFSSGTDGIAPMFSYHTPSVSMHDEINVKSLPVKETNEYERPHSNLPMIAISDCDKRLVREAVTRSSPIRKPNSDNKTFLEIPETGQSTDRCESGYSTSPSPDISCV